MILTVEKLNNPEDDDLHVHLLTEVLQSIPSDCCSAVSLVPTQAKIWVMVEGKESRRSGSFRGMLITWAPELSDNCIKVSDIPGNGVSDD